MFKYTLLDKETKSFYKFTSRIVISMQDKQQSYIENATFQSYNDLISLEKSTFRPFIGSEYFPEDISTSSNAVYYFNTTQTPLSIMDRDGVIQYLKPDVESGIKKFEDKDIRKVYHDSLIIVRTYVHDLNAINPMTFRDTTQRTAISEIDKLLRDQGNASACSEHSTIIGREYVKALKDHQLAVRYERNKLGLSQREDLGIFVTAIICIIKGKDISSDRGNYIQAADIVLRREKYDVSSTVDHPPIIDNHRPLIHPFSVFGITFNAEGGHSIQDPNIYFRTVRAIRDESYTATNRVWIVCFDGVRSIPISKSTKGEANGVYVAEKDESGVIRETYYSFEDAEKLGIFQLEAEANAEHRKKIRKYTDDDVSQENAQRRRELDEATRKLEEDTRKLAEENKKISDEAKEQARKETERKNEAQRKSDVVRYVTQVFGAVAALVTAAVTIVKLFAPVKPSFRLW